MFSSVIEAIGLSGCEKVDVRLTDAKNELRFTALQDPYFSVSINKEQTQGLIDAFEEIYRQLDVVAHGIPGMSQRLDLIAALTDELISIHGEMVGTDGND